MQEYGHLWPLFLLVKAQYIDQGPAVKTTKISGGERSEVTDFIYKIKRDRRGSFISTLEQCSLNQIAIALSMRVCTFWTVYKTHLCL